MTPLVPVPLNDEQRFAFLDRYGPDALAAWDAALTKVVPDADVRP